MSEIETTAITLDSNSLVAENIQNLVDKTLAVYQADSSRIIADYRAEKQYTADYDGRQILELLQNADDAETDAIHIEIDTATKTLTISNNGIPFSLNGVKSLMLANMSPKNKKEYIGNKGLGFRSILNWVNQVDVITKEAVLQFSEHFATENYNKILHNNTDLINHVTNDKNLVEGEIPFAILAIPKIKTLVEKPIHTTTVKLHYKAEEEKSILIQLGAIQEETLLFLRYTQNITILKNKEEPRVYIKGPLSDNKIQVNDKVWNIFHSGERTYDETKMYSFQIAWQDNLQDKDTVFYTYFPTDVKTHLPCLIHATFELNASRKEINPSAENHYILNEIAQALGELAITKIAVSPSNWQPYKFLNPDSKNDNKVLDQFYNTISALKKNIAIYPSTDNKYYKREEIYNYENDFSTWVIKNNLGIYFQKLVRPFVDEDKINVDTFKTTNRYTAEELVSIINSINPELQDLCERAKLIKLLLTVRFENLHKSNINLPLLIDRNDNLPTTNQLFTLRKEDVISLDIPSYVTGMSFILPDFFTILVKEFEEEIKMTRIDSEDVSRPLKRIIDKIVKIGSNDIIDVIRYIVVDTRNHLKNDSTDDTTIIKHLVNFLYSIFKVNPDRRGKLPFSIPLLNRNEYFVNSDDLFFGKEYHEGQLTEHIFEGIYNADNYLIGNEKFEISFENEQEKVSFYTWLGLNKFLKFQKDETETEPPYKYQELVFRSRPDLKRTYHYFKGIKVLEESILEKLTIEKLLVLISKDPILKAQLYENHKDSYKYKYGSGYPLPLYGFPSFIEYQLLKAVRFSEYIIESEIGVEHLFKTVDYGDEIFTNGTIYINEIKALLERLGAVKSLDSISISQFYSLFDNQKQMFPDGRGSSSFYKRFLDYCTKNKEISSSTNTFNFSEFMCYARKGGRKENPLELKLVSDIYYSDNNLVPQDVLDKYWIIYLNKRLGEQNVKKYFGVNLIQDVLKTIQIDKVEISSLNADFNEHINRLKPYFLYYRLDAIKDVNVKAEAINLTKNLDIQLVNKCSYNFGIGDNYVLQENFFIKIGNTFYLKNDSCNSVDALINNLMFCDTVAEVFNTHYKVKDHHDRFRAIFKDSIRETEYVIYSKEGENLLNEAKKLLGISTLEIKFWTTIFNLFKQEFPENIVSHNSLVKLLASELNYELPTDYHLVDFNDLSKKETIDFLRKVVVELSLNLTDIVSWETNGFSSYYSNLLLDLKQDNRINFGKLLWQKLNETNNIEEQKQFLTLLYTYQSIVETSDVKKEIENNYLLINWDVKKFFITTIDNAFSIDLKKDSTADPLTNLYIDLSNKYNIDEDLISTEVKSLFYFSGHDEIIKKYLNDLSIREETSDVETKSPNRIGKLHNGISKKLLLSKVSKSAKVGWSHGDKDITRNKRLGKNAEKLVYSTLVNEYGEENVQWMSSFSETSLDKADSYHFDIAYKPADEWKYLEVKAFNGRFFHLSREERYFGVRYPSKYEVALAFQDDVFIFKDLFKEGIDFENNPFYVATPSDYIISLEIENK